jgi:hypothetical protein
MTWRKKLYDDLAVRSLRCELTEVCPANGAQIFEFRDAGQQLANEVRQAGVASRKKRGT